MGTGMELRRADDASRRTPIGLDALQLYQLGDLKRARRKFAKLALAEDTRELAAFYLVLIDRALSEAGGTGWTLNLPADPSFLWETDWLRLIFGAVATAVVIDDRSGVAADRSIIVDRFLNAESTVYYRRNFENGVRQVLVHLSDEFYADDCSAYRWCQRVYRNYWSPVLADLAPVSFFALGYKTGFAKAGGPSLPAAERPYTWSFVGDPGKETRVLMLRHMRGVPNGFEHLISGWDSTDSLSTEDYRRVLDQSVFAPSPAGTSNLDCYRVYEALEAGCIPIVMRRPGYEYFDRLLPGHPMPVISDWAEAPRLISGLVENGGCEALRQTCEAWWSDHKAGLIAQVGADLC
jgi:hypothetical protein